MARRRRDEEKQFLKSLQQAIRERALEDMRARREAAVVNNVYGGGLQHPSGGVMGMLGNEPRSPQHEIDPGAFDYYVDIKRKDLPEINPETGKPMGWEKSVHRYRHPKGLEPEKKKE